MKILKGLDDRLPLDRWTISAPFLNNCLVPLLWVFWSQLEPGCLLPATACWAATPVLYWFVSQEGGGWRGSWIWTIRMLVLLDLRHGVQKHFLPRRTLATSPGRNPQLRKQPVWVLSSPSPLPCLEWAQWPLRHNPGDVAQAMLWINSTCCVWFSVSTAPGEGCCPRNPLPEALVCLTTNPTFLLPDPYHPPASLHRAQRWLIPRGQPFELQLYFCGSVVWLWLLSVPGFLVYHPHTCPCLTWSETWWELCSPCCCCCC